MAEPEKIRSWLFGIAYRRFLDHARKTKRRRELSQHQVVPDLVAGGIAAPNGQGLDVERAMDTLTPECRAVVMLTHPEAATATGLPLGTVKSHVNRGKAKLRTVLADYAPPQKSDTRVSHSKGLV